MGILTHKCERCGSCCKPGWSVFGNPSWFADWVVFTPEDVARASAYLGISESQFRDDMKLESTALYLKGAPCPFLTDKNLCSLQDAKPRNCAEWPKKEQIGALAVKYESRCPGFKEV